MKKIRNHILGILIYAVYTLTIDYIYYTKIFKLNILLALLLLEIWIFYSFFFTLNTFFGRKNRRIGNGIIVFIICLLGTFLFDLFYYKVAEIYKHESFTYKDVIYDASQAFTQFSIYALGFFFAQRSIQKQKQLRLSEQQQAEIEKAKLEIENKNLRLQEDFLRAQINPHFLYNCLNFFYTQTFQNNPNVAEGVLMLSDIMRYSLKDYSSTNGLANLAEEIAHVENVINIHQLRFSASLQIAFTIEGNPQGKLVAPMVLITLVENVFKHGDLHDKENPVRINCTIDASRENVYFSTYNKKKTGNHEGSTGIGLSNIKQRLQSLYKDNFGITTIDTATSYKKEITIPYFNQQQQQNFSAGIANHAIG
jgi:two-component system LytT family sensor kinase